MMDFPHNAKSFPTEDDARTFIITTGADPSPDNLARVGTAWVVVDTTPRPDIKMKIAKDDAHAAAMAALDQVAQLRDTLERLDHATGGRLATLESEIAALRAGITERVATLESVFGDKPK